MSRRTASVWVAVAASAGCLMSAAAEEGAADTKALEAAKLVEASMEMALPDARIGTLKKALKAVPTYGPALCNLGATHFEMREYARAEGYFKRAIEAEPDMKGLLSNYGAAMIGVAGGMTPGRKRAELLDAAAATLADAVDSSPDDPAARWYLGVAKYLSGELSGGLGELRKAVSMGPRKDEVGPPGRPSGPPKSEDLTRGLDRALVAKLLAAGDEKALSERPVVLVVRALGKLAVERARIRTQVRDAFAAAKVPAVRDPGFLEWLDAAWRGRNQAVTMQALMEAAKNDQAFGRKLSAGQVAELREVASRTVRAMTAFAIASRGDSKASREMRAAMGVLFRSSSEAALVDAVARRVLLRDAVYGGMHYVH